MANRVAHQESEQVGRLAFADLEPRVEIATKRMTLLLCTQPPSDLSPHNPSIIPSSPGERAHVAYTIASPPQVYPFLMAINLPPFGRQDQRQERLSFPGSPFHSILGWPSSARTVSLMTQWPLGILTEGPLTKRVLEPNARTIR
jgi:hypothetical protein